MEYYNMRLLASQLAQFVQMLSAAHIYPCIYSLCNYSIQTFDDGIQVTPFNLNEEMEEGWVDGLLFNKSSASWFVRYRGCRYFDAHGNYYQKDNDDIQDTWLQEVDWNKVQSWLLCRLA